MADRKSWSGLHSAILKKSRRSNMSAVVVKQPKDEKKLIDLVIAYPGCDFEVLVINDVAMAFRHGDVVKRTKFPKGRLQSGAEWRMMNDAEELDQPAFNAALVDHLAIAMKRITNGPQVVEKAAHFTDIIVKTIEELDELTSRNFRKIDSLKDKIFDVKQRLFSRLMSQDMRRK